MNNTQQIQQMMSLHQAVIKMADEINNTSENEYSTDENTLILGASDSNSVEVQGPRG